LLSVADSLTSNGVILQAGLNTLAQTKLPRHTPPEMKPPRRDRKISSDERTQVPFPRWWQRALQRLDAFHLRDLWWGVLDRWETNRSFRRLLVGLLATLVVIGVVAIWGYPWWTKRNSVKLAREWLAAGRINYAVDAVQQAIQLDPENPEPWRIAAELARLRGQKGKAVEYARHAANLAPGNPDLLIAWAAEAMRADLEAEAGQALGKVSRDNLEKSPDAQRLLGELARRNLRLDEAKNHFEAALRLDGPMAVDEVPLGLILLNAKDPAERQSGLGLLAKWATDRDWGATASRTLLNDALGRDDHPSMVRWAEALRLHPRCTVSDMPNCLLALSRADETRFGQVLTGLEKDHAVNAQAATQLLSWLNQIGRSTEAIRWMRTLPAAEMQRPPLAVAAAEALRAVGDWPGLQAWVEGQDWGSDTNFLRWAYGMHAARMLGDEAKAGELWRTLNSHAQLNSVHALFAGSTIYSWGRPKEAEALWWQAASQEGKIAIDALGTLARYYQGQRDADGQYRVFRQLHLLQPQDPAVGNNFAFFAALTGREQRLAEQVARANLAREPRNPIYVATCAFNLLMQNRAGESLALLKPLAAETGHSPVLAFAYGLALAGTNHKTEAHALLDGLPPDTLTLREVEVIETALKN
jgi:Tfp pilus assembly protein PilF